MTFKKTFQTLPTQFLELSNERGEPFVIPNVSPVSSPVLAAKGEVESIDKNLAVESEEAKRERSMSIIELN